MVKFSLEREDASDLKNCSATWDYGDGVLMIGRVDAEHRYQKAGQYTLEVELECGSEQSTEKLPITIYEAVDLAIDALEVRPLEVHTGNSLNLSFQLSNRADQSLEVPTNIDVFLTATDHPTAHLEPSAERIYRHRVTSFPASSKPKSVEKFQFEVPLAHQIRTGAYYLAVVVNADASVGELNHDNNAAYSRTALMIRNQATDGADLVALSLNVTPKTTIVLSSARADFEIVNQGSTTSVPFEYEIWLGAKDNATDMEGAQRLAQSQISASPSGIKQRIQDVLLPITPPITQAGLYYFWLKVDSGDIIVERDEDNNVVRSLAPIQVSNEPILDADILLNKVEFSPKSASHGGSFELKIGLFNQGSQPTGSFICTAFLSSDMSLDLNSDAVVGSINVSDLQAGQELLLATTIEVDASIATGPHWIYVFCDSSGVVAEANEDNNVQRSSETIDILSEAAVDLLFGPISLSSDGKLDDGETAIVALQLCNNGKTPAGPSQISILRENICSRKKTEILRRDVAGIEANQCETYVFDLPMQCDFWCPNYKLHFVADASQVIAETNENNNDAALTQLINLIGPHCACSGDSMEPNDLMQSAKKIAAFDGDLSLCVGDEDWFLLDLQEGDSFEAVVTHDHQRSPLSLELWQNGEKIDSDLGGSKLMMTRIRKEVGDYPYYLRVTGEQGGANYYHLKYQQYKAATALDLAASLLKIDKDGLSLSEMRGVSVQIDNNSITPSPSVRLAYYLSSSEAIDGDAVLLATQKLEALAPKQSVQKRIDLKLPPDTPANTYALLARVDDDNEIEDTRRSNNVARSAFWRIDRACNDILDPNEDFDTAKHLPLSESNSKIQYNNLSVCQDNRDIYSIDVKNGKALKISVTGLSPGDFDLVLYDAHENEVASARTAAATEEIDIPLILGDQRLYLEVFMPKNTYNSKEIHYDMTLSMPAAAPWLSCNANFEPNDFPSSSYDLRQAAQSAKTIEVCPSSDQDYYVIELSEGSRLQIGFETGSSALRAALYAGEELQFVALLTQLQSQTFDYTASSEGPHYLRIYSNASSTQNQSYRIVWLAKDGPDLSLGELAMSPTSLAAGQSLSLSFNASNLGSQSASYQYSLKSDKSATALYLSSEQPALEAGASRPHRHKITIPAALIGLNRLTLNIQATGDINLGNNSKSIDIDVQAACQNDSYEPNDNALAAAALPNGGANAVLCEGEEDWFWFTSAKPENLVLEFRHDSGDLDLYAYDAAGRIIASSISAQDTERVALPAAGGEKRYLRVKGANSNVRNSYRLRFE